MQEYVQSTSISEIKAKHPFPWRQQQSPPFVRVVDAANQEVNIFEITALCRLVTVSIANNDAKSSVSQDAKP